MNEKTEAIEYSIGLGKLGSQVMVWDTRAAQKGEYPKLAQIAPNRTVTYLVQGLPAELKKIIQELADSIEFACPPSPDIPVFIFVPPATE